MENDIEDEEPAGDFHSLSYIIGSLFRRGRSALKYSEPVSDEQEAEFERLKANKPCESDSDNV